jgi:ABC-type transport system involved in multi-copper enzyme maturation permease subunit
MIRLAWRQFRTPAAVALGALLVVAALAALTGPDLAHVYAATMAVCRRAGDCSSATEAFLRTDSALRTTFGTLVTVVPGLLGVFWGAPLIAREIEAGTFPLVWTQSVTRTRWLVVKLAVVGLAGMLVAGLLSLVVTWWARPLDRAAAAVYDTFGARDLAPIGYAALAFTIGVAAGMLIRRTVPAMAVTLFAFVVVRVCITYGIRPRIIGPAHQVLALDPASTGLGSAISPSLILNSLFNGGPSSALAPATPNIPNAWIYSTRVVDGSGRDLTDQVLNADCPGMASGGGTPAGPGHIQVSESARQSMQECVSKVGATYHQLVTYQPADRYWAFQWTELAIYGAAALLLGAFCVWWVRRRRLA